MTKKLKDQAIDQDATNPDAPKKIVTKKSNLKKKTPKKIELVDVMPTDESILEIKELQFDSKTMANVELVFVTPDTVQEVSVEEIDTGKVLPETIKLEEHEVLSKPEKSSNKLNYFLVVLLCAFFYAIGVATAFLYNLL